MHRAAMANLAASDLEGGGFCKVMSFESCRMSLGKMAKSARFATARATANATVWNRSHTVTVSLLGPDPATISRRKGCVMQTAHELPGGSNHHVRSPA